MHRLDLKIPPAVTGAVTAMGMWLVSRTLPTFAFTFAPLQVVAVGMGIAGAVTTGLAMLSFWRAHTTANPMKPSSTSSLVTSGMQEIPKTDYFDVTTEDGVLILRPVTMTEPGSRLASVRQKIKDLGIEPKDVDRAIAWARGHQGRRR